MVTFTLYHNPHDYPGKFVVRRWWVGKGQVKPDDDWFYLGETLEEVRAKIPTRCVRFMRDPNDEPQIVEFWI